MENKVIGKEQFEIIYNNLGVNPKIPKDSLFELFEVAMESANSLSNSNVFGKTIPINPVVLLLYLVNEYGYYLDSHEIDSKQINENETILSQIISVALDKYFTNEHLNFRNDAFISKYSPLISTLEVYLNFILGTLKKYPQKNPTETLVADIANKGFSISKAIVDLIVDGFETEAFSLWRTLHETECILTLLNTHGDKVIKSYLKHIKYALAYRGAVPSEEETDAIFVDIKKEMADLSLKSKDMKKFIEYGWLSSIEHFDENPEFKFNFRNGVELLAGLSSYSQTYEMASEIAHSSPLLIYSRENYYLHFTILLLYESFFRLEKIFAEYYLNRVSKEEAEKYFALRSLYYNGLKGLYQREKTVFELLNNKKASQ